MGNGKSGLNCNAVETEKSITMEPEKQIKTKREGQKQQQMVVPAKCKFYYIHPKMNMENGEIQMYTGESLVTEDLRTEREISENNDEEDGKSQKVNPSNIEIKKIIIQRNAFVKIRKANYLRHYIHIKDIGQGSYGIVSKIKMKMTGFIRAAKIIQTLNMNRKQTQKEKLIAEITIPMKLDHPNLNKLYEVYEWRSKFILIMDLCEGGDLFDKIKSSGTFSEKKVSQIMKQIMSAVLYLHNHQVVHRDLKPENILYDNQTGQLKIIDFGSAVELKKGSYLSKLTGSIYYIAPEVILGKYNEKCDIWSCGVILYILLSGVPPFYGKGEKQIMEKIINSDVCFLDSIWVKRSNKVKTLIMSMMNKNLEKRPSAEEVIMSDWMKSASNDESQQIQAHMVKNLQTFYFKNKLKAVVYTYIASQLYSDKDKEKMLKAFREIDKDGNGVIAKPELMRVFQEQKGNTFSQSEVERIIELVDTNDSGLIDFTQFLVAASNEQELLKRQRLENAFAYLDADKNGYITIDEIRSFLDGTDETKNQLKSIFDEVDKNGDGKISKNEFLTLLVNKKG